MGAATDRQSPPSAAARPSARAALPSSPLAAHGASPTPHWPRTPSEPVAESRLQGAGPDPPQQLASEARPDSGLLQGLPGTSAHPGLPWDHGDSQPRQGGTTTAPSQPQQQQQQHKRLGLKLGLAGQELQGRDLGRGLGSAKDRAGRWAQGLGSVIVAAGWGEVGAVVPDLRKLRMLRSQMRLVLKQLPLLERAGIGALAGGLAGGFTNATLHPIDTVKTKLQAKGASSIYSGPIDVVQKLSATQGLAGFYRGLPAAIVGSFVSSAIYFGTYELSKGFLSRSVVLPFNPLGLGQPESGSRAHGSTVSHKPKWRLSLSPLLIPPLSAALGNVASSAILVPKEVIKQRLQAGVAGTTWQVLNQTLREEGVKGLYAGYSAALLRNLPTNVLNFSLFEYLKAAALASAAARGQATALRPWQSILCGAFAGVTSSALTTPLDVVKTRLMTQARVSISMQGLSGAQAEAAAKAQAAAAYTYAGVISMLQTIFREEGTKGLMKGVTPRVLYGACFSAMGFFSYEAARVFLLRAHLERKVPRILHEASSEADELTDFEPNRISPPAVGKGLGN